MVQHEIIRYIERLHCGIDFSEDTLDLSVLEEGIKEGGFLGLEHTARHFRRGLWFPQLLDRRYWDGWVNAGRQDMLVRSKAMKDRLLREHVPTPLDERTQKDIETLLVEARRHLVR